MAGLSSGWVILDEAMKKGELDQKRALEKQLFHGSHGGKGSAPSKSAYWSNTQVRGQSAYNQSALTLSTLSTALKQFYLPAVTQQLNSVSIFGTYAATPANRKFAAEAEEVTLLLTKGPTRVLAARLKPVARKLGFLSLVRIGGQRREVWCLPLDHPLVPAQSTALAT